MVRLMLKVEALLWSFSLPQVLLSATWYNLAMIRDDNRRRAGIKQTR